MSQPFQSFVQNVLHVHIYIYKSLTEECGILCIIVYCESAKMKTLRENNPRLMTVPYKNSYFFVTTEPNWMGFSAKYIIISYSFKILKHSLSL